MGYDESDHRHGESVVDTRVRLDPPDEIPPAVLAEVFDDPAHGEPGRDRLGVHLAWEIVLLIAIIGLVVILYPAQPGLFREPHVRVLLVNVVALGLLTLAVGLSLRVAAPNLAVGPVAIAAGLHFAEQGDRGLLPALAPLVVVAAIGGLILALVVVGLHVPAWAASLAATAAVIIFIERRVGPVTVQGTCEPADYAYRVFAGFAALSVLGGLFGTIKAVRRSVGRFRPVADPARRRGLFAAVLATLAIVASTVFAALGGVLLAANGGDSFAPAPGFDWTLLAVGVALLGGTSAFGRRGGVAGTLLAVTLVTLLVEYAKSQGWVVDRYALGGAAMMVGLLLTRAVEWLGRPSASRERSRGRSDAPSGAGWSVLPDGPALTWSPVFSQELTEDRNDPWGANLWESDRPRWGESDR